MTSARRIWLMAQGFYELVRYEVVLSLRGSGFILEQLRRQATTTTANESEQNVCDAVLLATCFYWKPVLCLQRAICTVRLLRRHGIGARLVIGYRPSPFFSHAWVEVNGRVVYGSSAYQKRLLPLHMA